MRKRALWTCGVLLAAFIAVNNASCLARPAVGRPILLAHRGVHQHHVCGDIGAHGCAAACIAPPTHGLIENTIPSMKAAFGAGADVVELDVHPTTDGELAVFHDWRLECQTNGTGVTRDQSMAYLKTLDVGYGYTADGGKSFPLRGTGVGSMPSLSEVLDAFPDRRFLINIKSNDPVEGDVLARALQARSPSQRRLLMVYGGDRPTARVLAQVPEVRGLTRASVKSCAIRYAIVGWTGYVPDVCRHTLLILPENGAKLLWGWPHRFIERMRSVGTDVFVSRAGSGSIRGIDTVEAFRRVTANQYLGGVWTDRIEVVAPVQRSRAPASAN